MSLLERLLTWCNLEKISWYFEFRNILWETLCHLMCESQRCLIVLLGQFKHYERISRIAIIFPIIRYPLLRHYFSHLPQMQEVSPTAMYIELSLKSNLRSKPDYITLSGSGEPTLYSLLKDLIFRIKNTTNIRSWCIN